MRRLTASPIDSTTYANREERQWAQEQLRSMQPGHRGTPKYPDTYCATMCPYKCYEACPEKRSQKS